MKTFVSLAVALAAIPAGVTIATSSPASLAPPPGPDLVTSVLSQLPPILGEGHLRARVIQLSARARSRSIRLGLRPAPVVAPATSPEVLAAQELRLSRVVSFLAHRHEVALAVDERPVPRRRSRTSVGSTRLARQYAAVTRLTRRLGLDRPAAPHAAGTAEGRTAQIARWRAAARWLSHRAEVIRPDERPLSARIRHYEELMCIAGHESSRTWDISTGNGYYGGLQMDRGFARAYGNGLYESKGTPDHWTAEEQMRAAERAIATRGFTPWPNTARMCGLL